MSQDLSGVMNGVMWTQVVVAMLFVGARLYTRHFIVRNVGWDDIFMLVNLVGVRFPRDDPR
jgi:Na+(H+)/acetate symporter ActP